MFFNKLNYERHRRYCYTAKKIGGHQHIKFRKDYANYAEQFPNMDEFCDDLINKLRDANVTNKKNLTRFLWNSIKHLTCHKKLKIQSCCII